MLRGVESARWMKYFPLKRNVKITRNCRRNYNLPLQCLPVNAVEVTSTAVYITNKNCANCNFIQQKLQESDVFITAIVVYGADYCCMYYKCTTVAVTRYNCRRCIWML